MQFQSVLSTALAGVLLLGLSVPVVADEKADAMPMDKLRQNSLSADRLLSGDVKSVANEIGRIKDLLKSKDGKRVQYVLYNVPNRYQAGGNETGFAELSSIRTERDSAGTDVLLIGKESERTPDKLKLTRQDLRELSVSRMLGNADLHFGDDEHKAIIDLRIDPKTSRITHYVVEFNSEALNFDQPRAVSVDRVHEAGDGHYFCTMTSQELHQAGKF
jgi:hypothetical protein